MQDFLFWYFHHSYCPALIGVLSVEGLVNGAHGAFAELLGETVYFIGVLWQKVYLFDLFVELTVSKKDIIWDFLLLLKPSHDLDHYLWIVLDHFLADIVLAEKLHHFRSEALDAARTVEVDLQVHFMLEILRSK